MQQPEHILCFAGDNYRFSNPHSRYHLMTALHRAGHRILWVNSIGMNMPKVRRAGFLKRVALKLRSWAQWLFKADEGFFVLTPIALPLFGNPLIERLNAAWIGWQVRLACRLVGIQEPVVFASIPSFAPIVLGFRKRGLIYYYSDKYGAYRDITARDTIRAYDESLFAAADAVFCASQQILEPLAGLRDHVHYLPHAVDFEHFASGSPDEKAAYSEIPHPRIGYFGSLTDSNDIALMANVAALRPQYRFVLIGRVLGDYSELERLPNVHFLGFIPYGELPRYARSFDVGFMAWKMTDWIRHSNPLKTKEYLSLGLPIVSVRIAEIEKSLADEVYFFDDAESFADAIDRAIAEDSEQARARRRSIAESDSWDHRVSEMMDKFRKAALLEPQE